MNANSYNSTTLTEYVVHFVAQSLLFPTVAYSGVGNAAAAAALAAAPFRPKWCGKASSEPYISAEVGKG